MSRRLLFFLLAAAALALIASFDARVSSTVSSMFQSAETTLPPEDPVLAPNDDTKQQQQQPLPHQKQTSSCFDYHWAGPNTTSALDDGYWYYSKANVSDPECVREFRMKPSTCEVKRFSHSDMMECFRGKHIIYIGDSVTRYMFQALHIFLESGAQADPINCCDTYQSSEWMRTHKGFGGCGGAIRCDQVGHKIMDNMYYHSTEYGFNASFLGYFDHGYGHGPVGWFPDGAAPFSQDLLWDEAHLPQLVEVIREHFGKVDEIIVNSGQWHVDEFEGDVALAVEQLSGFASLMKDGKMPIWQTTCINFGFPRAELELGTQAAVALGWRIFDRRSLSRTLAHDLKTLGYEEGKMGFFDAVHFQPYVNAEYNNMLLNMICPK